MVQPKAQTQMATPLTTSMSRIKGTCLGSTILLEDKAFPKMVQHPNLTQECCSHMLTSSSNQKYGTQTTKSYLNYPDVKPKPNPNPNRFERNEGLDSCSVCK